MTLKRRMKKFKDKYLYILLWKIETRKEYSYYKKGKAVDYLKKWYKKKTGLDLNLEDPQTFTDKQQILKLYNYDTLITDCTDKYRMRAYVKSKLGEKVKLIPVIQNKGKEFFEDPSEIDYDELPEQFVIQCNHGAHMTRIVKSKSALGRRGFDKIIAAKKKELKINYAFAHGYEMNYKDISRGVFLTEYMQENNDLPDYKFFCTNGKLQFCWIDTDRQTLHSRTTFDADFERLDFTYGKNPISAFEPDISTMNRMKEIAEELAKDFVHVRVDMYVYKGDIYIGELTFSSGAGIELPTPREANYPMAKYLDVSKVNMRKNEKKHV